MGSPPRLRPGTSPQTFRIPPRGGHPVLRLPSRQTTNLGASPWLCPSFPTSCPFRVLLIHAPRPTRRYPRLWIWRPSSERLRDFNPPDLGAAQHTLRASLPPHTARPVPRGRPVGNHAIPPLGLPVLRWSPCKHAVATTPAGPRSPVASRFPLLGRKLVATRRRPSPLFRRVGSRITLFEACSAFTRVTACLLAESPSDPLSSKASTVSSPPLPLRLLPAGATTCRVGLAPTRNQHLFTAH